MSLQLAHGPILHPLAAKLNVKSRLANLRLANLLSGDTCPPISLSDFEVYLAFFEQTHQNLQFVVWFQDYRKRYHTRYRQRDNGDIHRPSSPTSPTTPPPTAITLSPTCPPFLELHLPGPLLDHSCSGDYDYKPIRPPALNYSDPTKSLPFKDECDRILATFLLPGAVKELTLDKTMRDAVIRQLTSNTHPDVLLPIYEKIYSYLETTSLPTFLAHATTNLDRSKQIRTYAFGFVCMMIGIIVTALLITLVRVPPQANRAWRLVGVFFLALGVMSVYSGWRGFCSQVFLQSIPHLRSWELHDLDQNMVFFVDRANKDDQASPRASDQLVKYEGSNFSAVSRATSLDLEYTFHNQQIKIPFSRIRNGFHRSPVFGPEKVVEDPRILATHRRVMRDITLVGLLVSLVLSGLVFAVPHPRL